MKNRNEPAFPEVDSNCEAADGGVSSVYSTGGLTKREYFASMAMQGMITALRLDSSPTWGDSIEISRCAVVAADALIDELAKEQSK